jgi:hypothetical protein
MISVRGGKITEWSWWAADSDEFGGESLAEIYPDMGVTKEQFAAIREGRIDLMLDENGRWEVIND